MMAKVVTLPDGRTAEFPDDMSNDAISTVLQKQFAPPQQKSVEQLLGPSDFTKSFASTPARMLKSAMQMAGAGNYVPDAVSRAAAEGDKSLAGRIAGDIAGTGGIKAGAGAVANALTKLGAAKGFLPTAGRAAEAATYGAGQGAITTPDEQMEAAMFGGVGGAGGQALGKLAGGLVTPTAEAAKLIKEGIMLSPGQAAGKSSWIGKGEQVLSSLPGAGAAIGALRNRGTADLNKRVIEKSVGSPLAGSTPREAMNAAGDVISERYGAGLSGVEVPGQGLQAVFGVSAPDILSRNPLMDPSAASAMERWSQQRLSRVQPGTKLTGDELKAIDSELGTIARGFETSGNAAERFASPAWRELQGGLRSVVEGASTGPQQAALSSANAAFRNLVPVKAAMGGGDVATALRLRKEMEKAGRSGHPAKELVEAGHEVLPSTVPNSGTAERLFTAGLPALLLGGSYGANEAGYNTLGAGLGAAALLGTKPGAKFMTGQYGMQSALAEALRRSAPSAYRQGAQEE